MISGTKLTRISKNASLIEELVIVCKVIQRIRYPEYIVVDECGGLILRGTCYKGFLYTATRNLPQAKQYCTTQGFAIADVIPEDYDEIMKYLTEISSIHLDDFYVALSYNPMVNIF